LRNINLTEYQQRTLAYQLIAIEHVPIINNTIIGMEAVAPIFINLLSLASKKNAQLATAKIPSPR
jgi:hypothetical protein